MLGVSDIASLLGVSVSMGIALALREIYEDLVTTRLRHERTERGDIRFYTGRRQRWHMIAMRVVVRVSGSSVGAWIAALLVNLVGQTDLELLAAGVGGALGWKVLDAVQHVFYERLGELVKARMKSLAHPGGRDQRPVATYTPSRTTTTKPATRAPASAG